jgi:activating molecule in BECN1-regulated autophagy protein 1
MFHAAELLQQRETGSRQICVQRSGMEGIVSDIHSWCERDFLEASEASYVDFDPAPRSTIALSYNCDGSLLASTHGDHTVKITICETKKLSKVLIGHRRTPWVVRFHPRDRYILASGSLDHEVRLWSAETGECIRKYTFGKPIASLSFHFDTDILSIACGHKLYVWDYKCKDGRPEIVLKTRRSMRAVHFHPHGLPIVLTAEVMDPSNTRDLPVTMTENGAYDGSKQDTCQEEHVDPSSVTTDSMWMDQAPNYNEHPTEEGEMNIADNASPNRPHVFPPSMVPLGWEVPFPSAVRTLAGDNAFPRTELEAGSLNVADLQPGQIIGPSTSGATYTSVWNIIGEDQPPRVWLRLWSFDTNKFDSNLEDSSDLLLSIQDAVLCSEMGVDFSPCGRFLVATRACRAHMQHSLQEGIIREIPVSMDWSPDRQNHRMLGTTRDQQNQISMPITDRVVFEVRIISMDGVNYGSTVKAKRIRAAHCLTSVQFSPTSEHILLGYGKKHSSLLRSLVAQQNSLIPLHTILEIVQTQKMSVTRALPSTEDEINAAAFHPCPGGGLAYGTKEGKLRFVLPNSSRFSPFGNPSISSPPSATLMSTFGTIEDQMNS